jgi:glycine/D-amino acid oxidase-like deaminating enzyme
MNRREFLERSSAFAALSSLSLAGCARKTLQASASPAAPSLPFYDAVPPLAPIRAHADRLFRITVCTRPFRAAGPRIEPERIGDKLVVHNYGHGGSGWSLSWGSSTRAVELALSNHSQPNPDVAVIGCGALGLTSATLLQRAGARVTIYAKERPPYVRSSRATGSWTPDSRVALSTVAAPAFAQQWEQMARTSWFIYQSYLGMPGYPIEYIDNYALSDRPHTSTQPAEPEIPFARYRDRIADLTPHPIDLPPADNPFPTAFARRDTTLMFNIADYSRQLVTDFLIAGGKIETVEFHSPADLASLPQPVIINCPGYAAKKLWNDNSLTPVRGQIGWLIPQPEVNYGFYYGTINVLSRRDGIVVQTNNHGEASGWNDDSELPDRAEAEGGVRELAALYDRMSPAGKRKA